jgi:hypothetical protein
MMGHAAIRDPKVEVSLRALADKIVADAEASAHMRDKFRSRN